MLGATVPQILYQQWFWFAILAVLLVALHFVRKKSPPPFPKSREFLGGHQKTIMKAMDLALIGMILLYSMTLFSVVREFYGAWAIAPESQEIRASAVSSSLAIMVVWSGFMGPAIGALSFFQANITKLKRIILLILCLLPVFFTTVASLAGFAENWRSVVQLGVMFSVPTWVVNGPGALIGQPFPDVLRRIIRKLRLVSGGSSS